MLYLRLPSLGQSKPITGALLDYALDRLKPVPGKTQLFAFNTISHQGFSNRCAHMLGQHPYRNGARKPIYTSGPATVWGAYAYGVAAISPRDLREARFDDVKAERLKDRPWFRFVISYHR